MTSRAGTFRERSELVVATAVVLYLAIFALSLAIHGARDPVSELFVFPVALLAVAFGVRAGALAGLAGVALTVAWAVIREVSLSPLDWADRIAPLLLLGILVGDATDRLERVARSEQALLLLRQRHREAAEINDSIVQGMAAAKWALEAGDAERATTLLSSTVVTAEALVAALLHDDPLTGAEPSGRRPGQFSS